METNYRTHTLNETMLIELIPRNVLINNAQDFLELVMNLPSDRIIFYKENINELFFDLRSGLAGEVLQKATNYFIRLGIVGNVSKYESKALSRFYLRKQQVQSNCLCWHSGRSNETT